MDHDVSEERREVRGRVHVIRVEDGEVEEVGDFSLEDADVQDMLRSLASLSLLADLRRIVEGEPEPSSREFTGIREVMDELGITGVRIDRRIFPSLFALADQGRLGEVTIGVEWEPQLTLLNHPQKPVFVGVTHLLDEHEPFAIKEHFALKKDGRAKNEQIAVLKMREALLSGGTLGRVGLDALNHNLEVRSQPVALKDFEQERRQCQEDLERFIVLLAKHVGPVGCFLPIHTPSGRFEEISKHVNVSWEDMRATKKAEFMMKNSQYPISPTKPGTKHRDRLHLRVNYGFTDYLGLVQHIMDVKKVTSHRINLGPEWDQPLLLGYSYGERYIRVHDLS